MTGGNDSVSEIQAAYFYLLPEGTPVARTIEVSGSIMVDVDADGRPIGVETLGHGDWQAALMTLAMTGRLRIA